MRAPCRHAPKTNAVLLGLCLLVGVGSSRYKLNIEPSVPVGLWRLHAVPLVVSRGDIVLFPAPEASWPFHVWYIPLLKPVAGIAGDVVCVDEAGLWVRGAYYGPIVQTAGGQPVPHIAGCHVVGAGEVFVASQGVRSLDSRYFGMVKVAELRATATPVLTWKGGN